MKYIYKINMVPCDAEYRLKAGDQVFVSAPRLGPKLRYPTHWALGSWAAGRADGTNSDKLLHLTPIRAGAGAWSRSSRAANEPSRSFTGPYNFKNLVCV